MNTEIIGLILSGAVALAVCYYLVFVAKPFNKETEMFLEELEKEGVIPI